MIPFLLCFIGAGAAALGAQPPADPYELVTGTTHVVEEAGERASTLSLLEVARNHYAVQRVGRPYDLKIAFHVASGSAMSFDGDWQMEDKFQPGVGLRWSAATKDYSIVQISSQRGGLFQSGSTGPIPLGLQESRAHLLGPMMSPEAMQRAPMRTANGVLNGRKLTCVLLANSRTAAPPTQGRRWDDMEECIDPEHGLLRVHSPAAGIYVIYDYSNPLTFAACILPDKLTVMEGGKAVIEERLLSLTEPEGMDPSLFIPSEEMRARGPGTRLVSLQRMSVNANLESAPSFATQSVVVFGLVTATGKIRDAHVLQQCDSAVADAAVEQIRKLKIAPSSDEPRQRHLFVRVNFPPGE
jgi:hypothetical protein